MSSPRRASHIIGSHELIEYCLTAGKDGRCKGTYKGGMKEGIYHREGLGQGKPWYQQDWGGFLFFSQFTPECPQLIFSSRWSSSCWRWLGPERINVGLWTVCLARQDGRLSFASVHRSLHQIVPFSTSIGRYLGLCEMLATNQFLNVECSYRSVVNAHCLVGL